MGVLSVMKNYSFRSLVCFPLLVLLVSVLSACGGGGGSSSSDSGVAPVAGDIADTVNEGGTTSIDIAANVTDADSALDLTSVAVVSGPANGSTVINADGTVDYTHDGSKTDADSFAYTMDDTSGATSNVATVNLSVMGGPMAGDIAETLEEGGTITIDIAANVNQGENPLDLASIAIVSGPANGSTVINADGTVVYTHDGSETGADSFTYTIDDTMGVSSNVATVSFTITPVNDAPTISGTPATRVGEGGFYSFTPTADDADGDTLIFNINNRPAWADFDFATGALTGSPGSGDAGTTTTGIVITVNDQQGQPNSIASLPPFDLSVTEGFNEALFATPQASSSTTVEGKFQANDGDPATAWVADSADASPSIQLDFDAPKSIYRVTLSDLPTGGRVTAGIMELKFSDGSSETIPIPALPDDGTPQEFVFEPRQTDWIKITLTQATGASGLAEIAADSALDRDQTSQREDLFNDGNANGWMPLKDGGVCEKGDEFWGVDIDTSVIPQGYQQTGDCRSLTTDEGVETGTHSLFDFPIPTAGMDLRLRLLAGDTGAAWTNGAIGVLFGYVNDNNYYRLDISGLEGHRKLWKKEGGAFTELNTSPQSYTLGTWFNLRIVHQNGVILVYMVGEKIMAVEDTTFSGGRMALFCARNESCNFDNVIILSAPSDPIVGLNIADEDALIAGSVGHKSGEYFVSASGTLDVSGVVTNDTDIGGVEFVLDEGSTGELSETAVVAPYSAQFDLGSAAGEHTVRAHLIDAAGQRLPDSGAMDQLPRVGVNGIHLVGLGDSITSGSQDDVPSDDISSDGRNTGGGYQSVLNDLLTADNPKPVTVLNEGNPGETSAEGADRVVAVIERTPEAQGYLVLYGANDARSSLILPSGLGLDPGDPGYAGSFKDNLEQIMSAILAAVKQVFPGKTLPKLPDDARNVAIQEFNQVVDELVTEKGIAGYTAPDFFAYFMSNPSEMTLDGIHPNGRGYQSMARGWCEALSGQLGLVCTASLF